MDETFARASFDATLDDLVEVTLRHYGSSKELRRSRRNTMLFTGGGIGVLVSAFAYPPWSQGYGTFSLPLVVLGMAVVIGFLSGQAQDDSMKKQTRRYITEQLGGARDVGVEVEIRSSGLWVRQDNVEYLNKWEDVVAVEETEAGVDMIGRNLLLVVRSRAFASSDARDEFISHARRLTSLAMP